MFSHVQHPEPHDLLMNFQIQETITTLYAKSVTNQSYKTGLTLLQVAAREGILELALHLLNLGAKHDEVGEIKHESPRITEEAKKLPIKHALDNGHLLLAEVLDFKNQSPTIKKALLYWGIVQQGDKFNSSFFNQIADDKAIEMSRIIELAAFTNNMEMAKNLFHKYSYESHPGSCTAGYWAIVHGNEEIYKLFTKKDKDVFLTLYQLHRDGRDEFVKCFEYADKSQQDKFTEEEHDFSDKTLKSNLLKIYEAASSNTDQKAMQIFCKNEKSLKDVFLYALQQQNYVALHQLMKTSTADKILKIFINEQIDVLKFLIISQNTNLYEFSLLNPSVISSLKKLQTEEGILKIIASRCIKPDNKLSKAELDLFNKVKHPLAYEVFIKALDDRYPNIFYHHILLQKQTNLIDRIAVVKKCHYGLSVLKDRLSRVNIHVDIKVHTETFQKLNQDMLTLIKHYLDPKSTAKFALSSRAALRVVFFNDKKNDKQILIRRLTMLNQFIELAEKQLARKNCLNLCELAGKENRNLTVFLIFVVTGLCIALVSQMNKLNHAADTLRHTFFTNSSNSCFDQYVSHTQCCSGFVTKASGRIDCTKDDIDSICVSACDAFEAGYFGEILSSIFFGILSLGLLVQMGRSINRCYAINGRKSAYDTIPIDVFSYEMHEHKQNILAEFKIDHDFNNLPATVSLGEFLEKAEEVKKSYLIKLSLLQPASEAKEDVIIQMPVGLTNSLNYSGNATPLDDEKNALTTPFLANR